MHDRHMMILLLRIILIHTQITACQVMTSNFGKTHILMKASEVHYNFHSNANVQIPILLSSSNFV
jgi:glycosylphosphatidylinositol transamidase (GPIT) subunit GPI8